MTKVYCHNTSCKHCKLDKSPSENFGICNKKQVAMIFMDEESAETSGYRVACMHSDQPLGYKEEE